MRVTGLHVYPGLFDAMSTIGLIEMGAVSATKVPIASGRSRSGGIRIAIPIPIRIDRRPTVRFGLRLG